MLKIFEIKENGFSFEKGRFPSEEAYKKAALVLNILDPAISESSGLLFLSFDSIYEYLSKAEQSKEIDSLLLNLNLPPYDKVRFEVLSEGKLDSKSFKLRVKTFNSREENIELKKAKGHFCEDQSGRQYFLTPIQCNFLEEWQNFNSSMKSTDFQTKIQSRLEAFEKLSSAYEKLEISGNSILDTLKIKIISDFQYNLIGNDDGSLDVIPSFEQDLQKYNNNLNALAETSPNYGTRVSLRDRSNRKNVQIFFTKQGAEAWENFYRVKRLSPKERTESLKDGDFLELFPPKEIIGDIFSERVIGFVLDSSQKIERDNKSSESWAEGFDDVANLLISTSGSTYAITLNPSPLIYTDIYGALEEFKVRLANEEARLRSETGAILTDPDLSGLTVYVPSLKDDFTVAELETLVKRIEKSNKPVIEEEDLARAKSILDEAKQKKEGVVTWKNQGGEDITIPRKSLELSIEDHNISTKQYHTIGVKVNESKVIDVGSQIFKDDWFLENINLDELKKNENFKSDIALRPHQVFGYAWLKGLSEDLRVPATCKSRGALLADDMGLGKTIQVIRLIVEFKSAAEHRNKPILVVAPLSLLETSWKADGFKAFLSSDFLSSNNIVNIKDLTTSIPKHLAIKEVLRIEQEIQDNPTRNFGSIELSPLLQSYINDFKNKVGSSIVLCSYETLRSRILEVGAVNFSLVILDEAQKIKNQDTSQSSAAKALQAHMKIAMTGTPIENTISDLWNICDFIVPGYLGTLKEFREKYQKPIASMPPGSNERKQLAEDLEKNLKPIWLRRTKKEVLKANDIPPIIHYDSILNDKGIAINQHLLPMSDQQYKIFESQVGYFNESKAGHKLAAIRNMMEACYAPWWAKGLKADYSNIYKLFELTPKLRITFEIVDAIVNKNEKVIIFANIKDLQQDLAWLIHQWVYHKYGKSIDCEVFNGDSDLKIRGAMLARFKNALGFKALIISPRSGGAGLNIVEANHVIHYTREWNPAVERQATDRVYRLGQTKTVHVYYPTSSLNHLQKVSAEEHLANILREKREIIDDFTVSQGDLGNTEDHFSSFNFSTNDTRLLAEGIRTLGPYKFEMLVAKYFEMEGFSVEVIGKSGDHGCDIVGHSNKKNILVQVKFSEGNSPQGTKPINEIRGAKSFYENKNQKKYSLIAATNTTFSPNAINLSSNGDFVELITGEAFETFLKTNTVLMSTLRK